MDTGVRDTEKPWRDGGDGYSPFPKVVFRPIDWLNHPEVMHTAELYWMFCNQVNAEDLSNVLEFNLIDGTKVQMLEAEAKLYGYKAAGAEIHLACVDDILVGFLICSVVFERILTVRCLYSEPWTLGLKLGSGLIQSVQPTPHTILFQARKQSLPERMLSITKPWDPVLIAEDEFFKTYSMKWGKQNDGTAESTKP